MSGFRTKDPNQKHYFRELRSQEWTTLFEQIQREAPIFELWSKGQEDSVEEFEFALVKAEEKRVYLKFKASFLAKLLGSKLKDCEVLLRFDMDDLHFFSKSTLRYETENKEYFITLDEEVFVGQKRKSYRLNAGPSRNIAIRLDGEVYPCLDVSIGGSSVLVDLNLEERFSKGLEFENSAVCYDGTSFNIPTVRVASIEVFKEDIHKPAKKLKLGLAFLFKKNDPEEERMAKHLGEEAREEELRKKMITSKSA